MNSPLIFYPPGTGGGGAGSINVSAGTTNNNLTALTFDDAGGVSFGLNGSVITAAAPVGGGGISNIKVSAGTLSTNRSDITFANSNGISFGLQTNGVITGTVATNYLTTARASNDGIGLNTAQTNVTWTVNSSGISINAGAYLTTAQPVGAYLTTARASNDAIGLNTALTANGVSMTANSSGLSLNFPAFLTTAQPVGAYLTTARASNDAVGLNTAQTNVTWTVNSSGISLNAGAYLTTAALSNHSHNLATTTTNGSLIVIATTNSAGATFAVPPFLTTAQAPGAYLTTARASNDAVGLNTAQTNVTWTVNSSGISINAGGYAGTGTSATNASVTLNSNGLQISVAAPGGGGNITMSGSNGSIVSNAFTFGNLNGLSFYTSNGSIVGSYTDAGAGAGISAVVISAGTTNNNLSNISFANANGVSFQVNGSTISGSIANSSSLVAVSPLSISTNGSTISVIYQPTIFSGFNPYPDLEKFAGQIGAGTLNFDPMRCGNFTCDRVNAVINFTNASNSSGSQTLSIWVGVYSRNASTLSLYHSGSASYAITNSGTAGSYSLFSGQRIASIPFSTSFSEGDYWIGFVSRTTSGGANASFSNFILSNIASNFVGHFGSSNNTTQQLTLGQGLYTATTSGIPGSVAFSQIRGSDSAARRAPFIIFANSTV